MTQPVSHGYPDYGRYVAVADKLIDQVLGAVITNPATHGRYFVGDVAYIVTFMTATVNHTQWRVRYWDRPIGGNLLASFTFSIRNLTNFDGSLPVMGPWLEFQITPSGANTEYTFIASTAHSPAYNNVSTATEMVLIDMNLTINAGLSTSVDAVKVWPGEAHWFVDSGATSFRAELTTIDYLGNLKFLDMMRFAGPGADSRRIFLPPQNTRLTIINSSAANISFRGSLVARPLEPGR